MRKIACLFTATMLLGGCSGLAQIAAAVGAGGPASYDCMPDGGSTAGPSRTAMIGPDRDGAGLVLTPDRGARQVLKPVAGGGGVLFASSAYAWRSEGNAGVLTDVEEVQSYRCSRTAPPRPASPVMNLPPFLRTHR